MYRAWSRFAACSFFFAEAFLSSCAGLATEGLGHVRSLPGNRALGAPQTAGVPGPEQIGQIPKKAHTLTAQGESCPENKLHLAHLQIFLDVLCPSPDTPTLPHRLPIPPILRLGKGGSQSCRGHALTCPSSSCLWGLHRSLGDSVANLVARCRLCWCGP